MEDYVFYLTKERQGLYLGNKLILTVEQIQNGITPKEQLSFDLDYDKED